MKIGYYIGLVITIIADIKNLVLGRNIEAGLCALGILLILILIKLEDLTLKKGEWMYENN